MDKPIMVSLMGDFKDDDRVEVTDVNVIDINDLKAALEPLMKAFKDQNMLMRDLVNAVDGVARALNR